MMNAPVSFHQHITTVLAEMAELRPKIEKALRHAGNLHSFDDLARLVCAGSVIAIHRPGSIMFVEPLAFPQEKVLHVFLAAGELSTLLEIDATDLSDIAKSLGARQITMIGREGWLPHLSRQGWSRAAIHMRRPVDGRNIRRRKDQE